MSHFVLLKSDPIVIVSCVLLNIQFGFFGNCSFSLRYLNGFKDFNLTKKKILLTLKNEVLNAKSNESLLFY